MVGIIKRNTINNMARTIQSKQYNQEELKSDNDYIVNSTYIKTRNLSKSLMFRKLI